MESQNTFDEMDSEVRGLFISLCLLLLGLYYWKFCFLPYGFRETVFWIGGALGSITPIGYLMMTTFDWVNRQIIKEKEILGCSYACCMVLFCLVGGAIGTLLWVWKGTHPYMIIGFVTTFLWGLAIIGIVRHSYTIIRWMVSSDVPEGL